MEITIEMTYDGKKIVVKSSHIEEILKELDNFEKIIEKLSSIPTKVSKVEIPEKGVEKRLAHSATELLNSSKATKLSDKLMILFYYLWKFKRTPTINVVDIKKIFREVMVPLPRNPTALMKLLQRKGFIQPEAKKNKFYAWSITSTGIKHVEGELLKKAEEGQTT
jgi:hypothetical protein